MQKEKKGTGWKTWTKKSRVLGKKYKRATILYKQKTKTKSKQKTPNTAKVHILCLKTTGGKITHDHIKKPNHEIASIYLKNTFYFDNSVYRISSVKIMVSMAAHKNSVWNFRCLCSFTATVLEAPISHQNISFTRSLTVKTSWNDAFCFLVTPHRLLLVFSAGWLAKISKHHTICLCVNELWRKNWSLPFTPRIQPH